MHRHEMLNEAFEEELPNNGAEDDRVKSQEENYHFIIKPVELMKPGHEENYVKVKYLIIKKYSQKLLIS